MPKKPILHLKLKQSALFTILLVLLYSGGMVTFWLAQPPWYLFLPILALTLHGLLVSLRDHALRLSPQAIVGLRQASVGGYWVLETRHGQQYTASLRGDSYLTVAITVLNFDIGDKPKHRRQTVIIMNDACDPNRLRQLRAHLRQGGSKVCVHKKLTKN